LKVFVDDFKVYNDKVSHLTKLQMIL
jgi:hypothetical protein